MGGGCFCAPGILSICDASSLAYRSHATRILSAYGCPAHLRTHCHPKRRGNIPDAIRGRTRRRVDWPRCETRDHTGGFGMNRRPFPQDIGCMAFGAMAGGAMAAEAVKHEPRRPNLPYVFAVELRAQGLMEPYKAVDVEALCAKRPNVHQRGHAGALTAANRFCTAMPPSPASTNRSAVCSTDRNAWGSSAQTILGQKICPPRPRPVDKPKAPANGSNGRKRAAKRKIVLHTAVLSMPKSIAIKTPTSYTGRCLPLSAAPHRRLLRQGVRGKEDCVWQRCQTQFAP